MSVRSGNSRGSQMSEGRREKLLDIQKREQLKGLLSSKFKLKYGNKPTIGSYIDNEVTKFLKNDRLTEDNLAKLDTKIMKEAELRDRKADALSDHVSQKSGGSRRSNGSRPRTSGSQRGGYENKNNNVDLEVRSVASSRMSGGSRVSKQSRP